MCSTQVCVLARHLSWSRLAHGLEGETALDAKRAASEPATPL